MTGQGDNSPFATALAQTLKTKDLEIGLAFRRVRDTVLKATGNAQEPHTYGSLSGQPYFLAGQSQEINGLESADRKNAWSRLEVDQEQVLQVAAREGDSRALKGLAYMRLNPEGDRFDPSQAAALLEKAAEDGDPEAMFELARMYERGIGVDQDVEKKPSRSSASRRTRDLRTPSTISDFCIFRAVWASPAIRRRQSSFFSARPPTCATPRRCSTTRR
ncbi:hypothetical protein QW131_30320 [Roseibium salinum]|nr:hypothetical protein [Roseibium salinum]